MLRSSRSILSISGQFNAANRAVIRTSPSQIQQLQRQQAQQLRSFTMSTPAQAPTIDKISPLSPDEAKWTELNKIEWTDQTGRHRVWESCSRKTRSSSGVDAVAIAPILLSPNHPPRTLLIMQYRPPVSSVCVELPAGLIDKSESASDAAVRELKEETGLAGKVVSVSPEIVSDPGLSNANMQFVVVECEVGDGELPVQELDEGEFIERRVVVIDELFDTLTALSKEEGKIVDARLYHWALGLHMSKQYAKK